MRRVSVRITTKAMAALQLLLALVTVSCVAGNRDARFFHTRNFWDGFESG